MDKKLLLALAVIAAGGAIVGALAWSRSNNSISYNNPAQPNYNYTSATQPQTPAPQASQINLEILNPVNGSTVKSAALSVTGKTVPGAEVEVNDNYLHGDAAGNFSSALTLVEGENYISVVAVDDGGNTTERELVVNYQLP